MADGTCGTCSGSGYEKVKMPCPTCAGSGQVPDEVAAACTLCGGAKTIPDPACSGTGQQKENHSVCGGTGMTPAGQNCYPCGGTGHLPCFKCAATGRVKCPQCQK